MIDPYAELERMHYRHEVFMIVQASVFALILAMRIFRLWRDKRQAARPGTPT